MPFDHLACPTEQYVNVSQNIAIVGFYLINFPPNRLTVADIKVAGNQTRCARGARFGAVLCPLPFA